MELINVLLMTLVVHLSAAYPYGDISSPATLDIKIQYCGPRLTKILSSVCKLTGFASPPWDRDDFTRRDRVKRDTGIVEECCKQGCSWRHLSLYCVGGVGDERIFFNLNPRLGAEEPSADSTHVIADRSAEGGGARNDVSPATGAVSGAASEAKGGAAGGAAGGAPGEVGRRRMRGRCTCRRRRRVRRRRTHGAKGAIQRCTKKCARSRHRIAGARESQRSPHRSPSTIRARRLSSSLNVS